MATPDRWRILSPYLDEVLDITGQDERAVWLPHRRLYVRTEMMIEAPAQYLIAEGGYLWIQMRIDNLRRDGLVFRDLEGICDHAAFGIAQPRRRLVSLQHQHATLCFRWPDVLLLDSGIEGEHGS